MRSLQQSVCDFLTLLVDMAEFIKVAVTSTPDPTVDERNLLSVAYKNTIGARRASWRVLSQIEGRETQRGRTRQAALVSGARAKLEIELSDLSKEVLRLLHERLVPTALSVESRIFYNKMCVRGMTRAPHLACSLSHSGRATTTATSPSSRAALT